jgi:hypothetical protein
MSRLRAHPIIAARDYYYSYVNYEEEKKAAAGSTYFTRLRDCFTIPRIRRANYGASTVMIAQQMCGINSKLIVNEPVLDIQANCNSVISFYSSSIFTSVGYTDTEALYTSLGYGAIQVVATIPTLFLIDTKGRRKLCLIVSKEPLAFVLAAISDTPRRRSLSCAFFSWLPDFRSYLMVPTKFLNRHLWTSRIPLVTRALVEPELVQLFCKYWRRQNGYSKFI